jgi:hypothetical protein
MTRNRIFESDKLGSPISSERRATWPAVGNALAAASRHRVLLGSLVMAVMAILVWRSTVGTDSTPVAPGAVLDATSAPERQLEIIVLGVHDAVAAPAVPPELPVAVARPMAGPASVDPPPSTVSAPSRAILTTRSAPARAQSSSGAKASPLPVATVNSTPAQEPRVEVVPAKPPAKPDGPPMEINPYVYK